MYSKSVSNRDGTQRTVKEPDMPAKDIKVTFSEAVLTNPEFTNSGKSLRDFMIDQVATNVGESYRPELESVIEQSGDNALIYRTRNAESQVVKRFVLSLIEAPMPSEVGTLEMIEFEDSAGETQAASHFSKYKGLYIGAGVLTVAIIIMGKSRKS